MPYSRAANKKWAEAHLCTAIVKLLKFNSISLCQQLFQRSRRELAPAARLQLARQLDGAVARADEPAHLVPDGLEDPSHLAVSPLAQHHPVPAIGPACLAALVRNQLFKARRDSIQ